MALPPAAEKGSLEPCPHRNAWNCQLPTHDRAHRGPGWTPRKPPILRPGLFSWASHTGTSLLSVLSKPPQVGLHAPSLIYTHCQVSLQPLPSLPTLPQPLLPPQPSILGCQARPPLRPQWPAGLRKLTHLTARPRPSCCPPPGAQSTQPAGRPPWRPCPTVWPGRCARPLLPPARAVLRLQDRFFAGSPNVDQAAPHPHICGIPRPEGWPRLPGAHSPCSQEEKAPRHL